MGALSEYHPSIVGFTIALFPAMAFASGILWDSHFNASKRRRLEDEYKRNGVDVPGRVVFAVKMPLFGIQEDCILLTYSYELPQPHVAVYSKKFVRLISQEEYAQFQVRPIVRVLLPEHEKSGIPKLLAEDLRLGPMLSSLRMRIWKTILGSYFAFCIFVCWHYDNFLMLTAVVAGLSYGCTVGLGTWQWFQLERKLLKDVTKQIIPGRSQLIWDMTISDLVSLIGQPVYSHSSPSGRYQGV